MALFALILFAGAASAQYWNGQIAVDPFDDEAWVAVAEGRSTNGRFNLVLICLPDIERNSVGAVITGPLNGDNTQPFAYRIRINQAEIHSRVGTYSRLMGTREPPRVFLSREDVVALMFSPFSHVAIEIHDPFQGRLLIEFVAIDVSDALAAVEQCRQLADGPFNHEPH